MKTLIRRCILRHLIWVCSQKWVARHKSVKRILLSCRFACHAVIQLHSMSSAARETFLHKYFSGQDCLKLKLRLVMIPFYDIYILFIWKEDSRMVIIWKKTIFEDRKIMCPHRRGGGHFVFGADPIGFSVQFLVCTISHEPVGGFKPNLHGYKHLHMMKSWLGIADLDLIFKVTARLKLPNLSQKVLVCTISHGQVGRFQSNLHGYKHLNMIKSWFLVPMT